MLDLLTYMYMKSHGHTEVSGTDKNKNKRSYDFTVCLPFWDALTGSQQQMLRLNTIVRSYRAGDNVIFPCRRKTACFSCSRAGCVCSLRRIPAGRSRSCRSSAAAAACSIRSTARCRATRSPSCRRAAMPCLPISTLLRCARCAPSHRLCSSFCSVRRRAMSRLCSITLSIIFPSAAQLYRPRRARKGRRAPRGRLRAHYPRRDLPPPRHHARGHQQGAGGHASDGSSANRPRQDLCARSRRSRGNGQFIA